jgi:hypothetical protein
LKSSKLSSINQAGRQTRSASNVRIIVSVRLSQAVIVSLVVRDSGGVACAYIEILEWRDCPADFSRLPATNATEGPVSPADGAYIRRVNSLH